MRDDGLRLFCLVMWMCVSGRQDGYVDRDMRMWIRDGLLDNLHKDKMDLSE